MPNPSAWWVRASGSVEVPPSRAVIRSRRSAAATREADSASTRSGEAPSRWTRSTTASMTVVVLPVPGAPRTRSTPPRCATAACWTSSRSGASATRPGARRRVSTQELHHTPLTRSPAAVPSHRARAMSTRPDAERAADQGRALGPPVGQRLVLQPRGRVPTGPDDAPPRRGGAVLGHHPADPARPLGAHHLGHVAVRHDTALGDRVDHLEDRLLVVRQLGHGQ